MLGTSKASISGHNLGSVFAEFPQGGCNIGRCLCGAKRAAALTSSATTAKPTPLIGPAERSIAAFRAKTDLGLLAQCPESCLVKPLNPIRLFIKVVECVSGLIRLTMHHYEYAQSPAPVTLTAALARRTGLPEQGPPHSLACKVDA